MGLGGLRSHQRSSPSSASRFSVIGNDEVLVNASKICYSRTRVDRLIRSTLGNTIPKASRKEGSMNELSGLKVVFERHCSWEYIRASTVVGDIPVAVGRVWLVLSFPACPREPCLRRRFSCPGFPSLVAPQELCR